MAQKVSIILVDDLDGEEAESIETIAFGLDGDSYEIDLKEENAMSFRAALAQYVSAGRVTQKRRGRKPAALAQAQTQAKVATGTKRGGTRKRTASMDEIEASKA